MTNERKFLDAASHAFIKATNGLLDGELAHGQNNLERGEVPFIEFN